MENELLSPNLTYRASSGVGGTFTVYTDSSNLSQFIFQGQYTA